MTSKHTPTPYRPILDMDGRHHAVPIMCEAAEFIGDAWPYHPRIGSITHGHGHADKETAEATALFICKAVNHYGELVEVLRVMLYELDHIPTILNSIDAVKAKTRALLAKLGEV